jgi:hypothetical protein
MSEVSLYGCTVHFIEPLARFQPEAITAHLSRNLGEGSGPGINHDRFCYLPRLLCTAICTTHSAGVYTPALFVVKTWPTVGSWDKGLSKDSTYRGTSLMRNGPTYDPTVATACAPKINR